MWYPTLKEQSNTVNTHSWYDMCIYNPKKVKKKKIIERECSFHDTNIIKITVTEQQHTILQKWLNDFIDIYNLTNKYIQTEKLVQKEFDKKGSFSKYFKYINFIDIRKLLYVQLTEICKKNGMKKHCADEAVNHCVSMYKSAISNQVTKKKKNKNHIMRTTFEFKDMKKDRRRKIMKIEVGYVNKTQNSFCSIGEIKSSLPLYSTMKSTSTLQYDTFKKTYKLIVPKIRTETFDLELGGKCGIDIGVRTFLTVYNDNQATEIGKNSVKMMDRIHERIDNIKMKFDKRKIKSKKRKEKLLIRCEDKLKNKITDMHNKVANYLVKKYDKIIIGDVSVQSMISNDNRNQLDKKTKRRLVTLSHYSFRLKLKQMAVKYRRNYEEVSEYMTSKTCHSCKNIKTDLGSSKIYKCENCNIILDRDVNASINIYNLS